MHQQHQQLQQLLENKLTPSQILRIYGKQFKQVQKRYSDGRDGRCAVGVIMSYYGWNGKDDLDSAKVLLATLNELKNIGFDKNFLINLNDLGLTFDQIADYLDGHYDLPF
jgi:hypothetical protein